MEADPGEGVSNRPVGRLSRSAQIRRKLKENDPEKYSDYLAKQRAAAKERREKLKAELARRKPAEWAKLDLEHRRKTGRERQKRYEDRKRQKTGEKSDAQKQETKKPEVKVTRKSQEDKRSYWRIKKKEQISRWSFQKKNAVKKKDRERKRKKSAELKLAKKQCKSISSPSTPFIRKQTQYNAVHSAKKSLPASPRRYANVVEKLIDKATPKKRKALEQVGVSSQKRRLFVPELKSTIQEMRKKKETRDAAKITACNLAAKFKNNRQVSFGTGVNRKLIARARRVGFKRLPRKDRLSSMQSEQVKNFYKREDVSRPLPDKRYATKKHGNAYALQIILKAAFRLFKTENPDIKIGFTKFTMLRPKNVKLLSECHREVCLCPYCLNVQYKLLALNRAASVSKVTGTKLENEYALVKTLLCNSGEESPFPAPECMLGECNTCKDLGASTRELYTALMKDIPCTWNRWESVTENGKTKKKLVTRRETTGAAIEELVKDIVEPAQGTTFPRHLLTARWQYRQFHKLKEDLPRNWLLLVMDFAKNRSVKFQDEIKSAYYSQAQITVHPVVAYYKPEGAIEAKREALIFMSDDTTHDYHAVNHYTTMAVNNLRDRINPSHVVIFSDGCASQYKGRGTFADLSLSDFSMERNFYGSEHGKGEGDGEIGSLSKTLDRAIIGRQTIINNATDMFNYCSSNLASNSKSFFLVAQGEINRQRPETEVKTLQGCRKLHQARKATDPYSLKVRRLSCFCEACVLGLDDECENQNYVGLFMHKTLQHLPPKQGQSRLPKPTVLPAETGPASVEDVSPSLDGQDQDVEDPKTDDWCVVVYDGALYPGTVVEVDEDEFLVSVLHPIGDNKFIKPSHEDQIWYKRNQIVLGRIEKPTKPNNRGRFYCMSSVEWDKAKHVAILDD